MSEGSATAPAESAIGRAHAALHHWMHKQALPFWASKGCDAKGLGFVEHLNLGGSDASVPYKRVRVQARQIYVFSNAAILGWPGAIDMAGDGFDFMVNHALRDDGSWARRLGPDGGVTDNTADLYDLAFVLFALAWYAKAAGSNQAIGLAYSTMRWIGNRMASPSGGFHNMLPIETGPRQQNPHMHLLEAMLALFEATKDPFFVTIADDLVALFRQHFYDPVTATLGEFFNDDWSPVADVRGTHIEPGHHYEWVWLLQDYARLTGRTVPEEVASLYRFANTYGVDPETGLVIDIVDRQGNWRQASARLWPQTEAIKAHLAMAASPDGRPDEVERIVNNLMKRYFNCDPAGTWIDHLTLSGVSKADKIPSSSLYHVFMAYAELDKAAKAL